MEKEKAKRRIQQLQEMITLAKGELSSITRELDPEHLTVTGYVVGKRVCDKSPFGICMYDHIKDPIHNFCIYCENPERRR